MLRRAAHTSAAGLALALFSWSQLAWSQSTQEQALAEGLFRDGRELLERGEFAAACGKLDESYKLDPASGTLLNLALCHEREGKLATAWVEFQNALARVRREGSEERVTFARESIARIEPKVPRIRLAVAEGEGQPVMVELDGTALGRAAWGGEMPVDPGVVHNRATAAGRRAYEAEISIEPGQILVAKIPALVPEVEPAAKSEPQASAPTVNAAKPAAPSAAVVSAPADTHDDRRVAAYVATGAGVLGVVAGTTFGIVAILQKQESDPRCPGGVCKTDEDLSLYETAQLNARLSNAGFALGVVGLGVGAYLFLTEPAAPPAGVDAKRSPAPQKSPRVEAHLARTRWMALPTLGSDGAGMSVTGRF